MSMQIMVELLSGVLLHIGVAGIGAAVGYKLLLFRRSEGSSTASAHRNDYQDAQRR